MYSSFVFNENTGVLFHRYLSTRIFHCICRTYTNITSQFVQHDLRVDTTVILAYDYLIQDSVAIFGLVVCVVCSRGLVFFAYAFTTFQDDNQTMHIASTPF